MFFCSSVYLLCSSCYFTIVVAMCVGNLLMSQVLLLLMKSLAWTSMVTIEYLIVGITPSTGWEMKN